MIMDLLRQLFSSKKFVAMLGGLIVSLTARIGFDLDIELVFGIMALVATYVFGQGQADKGKEAEIIRQAAEDAREAKRNGTLGSGGYAHAGVLALVFVLALASLFSLQGCGTTASAGRAAQGAMEPYAFNVVGDASGQVAFNSRFLAVNANVSATVQFLHNGVVRWERVFNREAGARAYELVIEDAGPKIIEADFSRALASIRAHPLPSE